MTWVRIPSLSDLYFFNARIAGTRTKMELAWQKERDSQKKLINELNTMARDLKSTLLVRLSFHPIRDLPDINQVS